jgi:predicted regulator of Ras-like GTPase activity (Roadblock/LC7/MglB family)
VSVRKTKDDLEDVSLLKFALVAQLKRTHQSSDVDVLLFAGADGKIYASYIPESIGPKIFELTNLISNNLLHVSQQLEMGLKQSVIEYEFGTVIFSSVGRGALLISLFTGKADLSENMGKIEIAKAVMQHIFEQRPMTKEQLATYSEEVASELRILAKIVFDEMYTQSSEYKKNMEILADIKEKITSVMGRGEVEQVLAMAFNEIASSPKWMTEDLWPLLLEMIINDQIRPLHGDYVADVCEAEWIPDINHKLESFV